MQPENKAKLIRIRKISGALKALSLLFIGWCVLALWHIAKGPIFVHGEGWGIGTAWYTYSGVQFKVYSLTVAERIVAATSLAIYWGLAILCGLQLFRLLGLYSRGDIFGRQSADQIRRWGLACVAWGTVKVAYAFLPFFLTDSRGEHGADPSLIVFGLGIIAISWFVEIAAEMQAENDLTV